ncbi:MAG: biotin carboxylase N-terminal domain-containing protein, partial [Candidatus Binatia bacterium]|nr:biotin carboxylase N-terminal domain-containing protein [Candidatus Binatia bacterium]
MTLLPVGPPGQEIGTLVPEDSLGSLESRRPGSSPVRHLAIVSRPEAALRCIRTVRALRARSRSELESIAIYTEAEQHAPFVRWADLAVQWGGCPGDFDALFRALHRTGADAIWPGWGALARDPAFAGRVVGEGFDFVGPSARSMWILGDATRAQDLAETVGVASVTHLLEPGRRIDVTIVGDRHGHVVALASSECTRGPEAGGGIEEAPPPGLGARVVRATCDA